MPVILFGAFDRHNLGDLLFAHIAAKLLGKTDLCFAGVVDRDLCSTGGFRTQSIAQLAKAFGERPVNILHVGGELLTCEAWQAAVMVQEPAQVPSIIRWLEGAGAERERWTSTVLGFSARAPYVVSRELFPGAALVVYTAVGGVELNERNEPFRSEVVAKLLSADYVSVRDQRTWQYLKRFAIPSRLVPDPVALVAELFGERIEQRAAEGEAAALQAAFPHGYLACQFSADFGDDGTLRQMAAQLDKATEASGYGLVLFRVGAAPWHDDSECYRRLAGFMQSAQVKIFHSLDIWEICAVIAHSRGYCGSSLHGRIVAMAYGLPRINFSHPEQRSRTGKQAAYASTWELPGLPTTVEVTGCAAGIRQALAAERTRLQHHALVLAARYREEFKAVSTLLKGGLHGEDETPK